MTKNSIAIVIPAYNEEKTIRAIVEKTLRYSKHIVVVNDGSTDKTAEQLIGLPITLLNNPINQGKGNTLLKGFLHAQTLNVSGVISIDADTQHDPDDIPKFINTMSQYANHIIIGARLLNKENAPKSRYVANKIADFFISWAAGKPIIDSQSGYRLYPMKMLEKCLRSFHYKKFGFESALLILGTRCGYTPASIPIRSHYPRDARPSHYHPFADTARIIFVVAWKIISRGLCLPGLCRAFFHGAVIDDIKNNTAQS